MSYLVVDRHSLLMEELFTYDTKGRLDGGGGRVPDRGGKAIGTVIISLKSEQLIYI
jgi:hypothetical protein